MLVISDGQDNSSRYTLREIERLAKESDVMVYSIGIMEATGNTMLDLEGADALNRLADITGGQAFFPGSLDQLESICSYIALELRSQYNIGYYPDHPLNDRKCAKDRQPRDSQQGRVSSETRRVDPQR